MVFDLSLEMQSDSKNYVTVQDDEITELVDTIKSNTIKSNCSRKRRLNLMRRCDVCLE